MDESLRSRSLLPGNATAMERALEAVAARVEMLPTDVRMLWHHGRCPEHLLPWLAWALGVDDWQPQWTEGTKRRAIRDALALHQHKGTLWAVRQAAREFGLGSVRVSEGDGQGRHDGMRRHDGSGRYGDPTRWAVCRVSLSRPVSNTEAVKVRRALMEVMPARCHLLDISFEEASNDHQGVLSYDGNFNYGAA